MKFSFGKALIAVGMVILWFSGFEMGHHVALRSAPKNATPQLPPTAWSSWTQWSEAKITSDMWQGTKIWQFRTNLDSGECQGRCQLLSPTGGYK